MEITEKEEKMFFDFYDKIEEFMLDLKVEPNDKLIGHSMKRVDSDIVSLYEQLGVDNKEFRKELYKVVKETLKRNGVFYKYEGNEII